MDNEAEIKFIIVYWAFVNKCGAITQGLMINLSILDIRTHYGRPSILTPIFYAFNLIRKKHKYVNHQMDIFKGHAECFRANLKMIIKEFKKRTNPKVWKFQQESSWLPLLNTSWYLQPKTTTTTVAPKTTSSPTTTSTDASNFFTTSTLDSELRPRRRRRSFQRVVAKSIEDCMYLKRPALYGFRVSVTLSENEPCELGVSCKGELIISGGTDLPEPVNATFFPGKLTFRDMGCWGGCLVT
jgi:hypothetical protein